MLHLANAIGVHGTNGKTIMSFPFSNHRAIACGLACAVLAIAAPAAAPAQEYTTVNVGAGQTAADAPLMIADAMGFFREQGIVVRFVSFDAAAKMMAPLGTGQLDVAAGAPSAALYNAIAAKIDLKMVADKGSTPRNHGSQPLLVRKDLITSGRYKTVKDLKGLSVAEGSQGTAGGAIVERALKSAGLQYNDVKHVYMGFPQMVAAFSNGAIDAAVLSEPLATQAERDGTAVRVLPDDVVYPGQQLLTLIYGGPFITTKRALAEKFMVAYLKGVRAYDFAASTGHLRGPGAPGIVKIMTAFMKPPDPTVFASMTAPAYNPNGTMNVESLKHDLAFFREQGYVTDATVTIENSIDTSFAAAAAKKLGAYHPPK